METWHFMWILAACWGLVSAGLVGSAWAMVSGERPHIDMLSSYHLTTPLRAFALVAYAPLGIVRAGMSYLNVNPAFAVLLVGLGTVWSFLQGVFILTTVFGYT